MSFEAIVDDGQRAIKTTTAHFESMAQVRYCLLTLTKFCNCSTFCCTLLYVHSSFAIILKGKRGTGCFA